MSRHKAPGKSARKGISLFELQELFPNEEAAREWFEGIIWPNGPQCPHCDSHDARPCKNLKPMPYRCGSCRKHYSVKTDTLMHGSPLPLLKWVYAIYLDCASLKGVASMKLYRELGITQKTAWFMQQRIREAFADQGPPVLMRGPVEVDETYVGGKARNMHYAQRKQLTGRGGVDKTAVVGAKDRKTNRVAAEVVQQTDRATLQGFVFDHTEKEAEIYTDSSSAYKGLPNHSSV
ncbi:MAG: IS1595 family transposase, partial [Gammaproteobacteria bacterium]|nr:IS1595 family transposase [Gammaproteobacteria bacterium]